MTRRLIRRANRSTTETVRFPTDVATSLRLQTAKTAAPKNSFHQHLQPDRHTDLSTHKNSSFFFSETMFLYVIPPHTRGVSRSSRTLRRDAVGASGCSAGSSRADERSGAHGQAVWSWHPGADAPRNAFTHCRGCDDAKHRRENGGKNAGPRGERGVSRKAIAQGRPVVGLVPVVLPRAFLLHADHGCSLHPAFPAPSRWKRAKLRQSSGAERAAGRWIVLQNAVLKGTPSVLPPFPLL
jgi:hypothetical protein